MNTHPDTQKQQPGLWVDGYITQTFGPVAAQWYHTTLLKRGRQDINWHAEASGSLLFFFAPVPGAIGPGPVGQWVIDCKRKDTGLVIPQQIWHPQNSTEVTRYVVHEQLCPPIYLVHRESRDIGLPLTEVAAGNCMSLHGANQTAPVGPGHHAQIHTNWAGYPSWEKQIMIRRQNTGKETVSLETFAKRVAGRVMAFMEMAKSHPESNSDRRWFIGDNWITPHDITLIGVVQVSKGSWMPILQLNDRFDRFRGF